MTIKMLLDVVGVEKNEITFSVVVPVYNSEQTILPLYERLTKVMEELNQPFEFVFVEDCSADNSWQVLQRLSEKDERVNAIQLMRNYGQASATMCGLSHSSGHFMITIDDDLQNPPEEIPVLLEALKNNIDLDVIIGVPYEKQKKHTPLRNFGSYLVNIINSSVFKKNRSLKFTSFRIIRRPVVECLVERNVPQPAIGALLYSITPRISHVYVRHDPRQMGRSGYTFSKMFVLALSNFLAYSNFPLRFLSVIGIMGIIGSFLFASIFLIRYLLGGIGVPGWMTQVLLLLGISGFNFFAFGLLGEYLLRILQSVHETPQYVIRQQVGTRTHQILDKITPKSTDNLV